MSLALLLVEDSEIDAELVLRALSRTGIEFSTRRAMDRASFLAALAEGRPDLIICDHNLPQFEGREALGLVRQLSDPPPFILVTGSLDEETAVEYMRSGAADYILKDRLARLGAAVRTAVERDQDRRAKAKADQSRRGTEARLGLLARATNDAIWDLDPARDTLDVNEGFRALFGHAPGAPALTIGAWHARIHPADRARVQDGLRVVLESRATYWTDDYRLRRPDGSYAQVLDRAYILRDERGSAVRVVGAIVDVAERQRLLQQLRESQKMEAVGRLAGGIAHDFNNVLTGILITTDLLLGGEESEEARRADLQEVRLAAERAAHLTRQLLAFSRRQVIELRRIDPNGAIDRFASMLRRIIGESVILDLVLDTVPGAVRADAGQLEQILLNLAVNARDAMPRGGRLRIETAAAELDEAWCREHVDLSPGPYVRISVIDTGSGIPPAVRDRMFEPFFTTKEPGQGTGLGLSTVYGIVRQHGGGIAVDSEPGIGSAFHVYLPRVDGPPDREAGAPAGPVALDGSETILLVEDEERVRDLIRRILERRGYTVRVARDADEALAIASREAGRIDLVLTDVVLPGESGPALSRRLVDHGVRAPVLFLSGYSEEAIMTQGHIQPDALFLAKPFTASALAEKVRQALGARRSA